VGDIGDSTQLFQLLARGEHLSEKPGKHQNNGILRTTRVSQYEKGNIILRHEMLRFWDGSGIGQTMCKQCQSAPCCKQITTPPADCSVMCWMLFLNPTSSVKALENQKLLRNLAAARKYWGNWPAVWKREISGKILSGKLYCLLQVFGLIFLVGHLGPYVTLLTEFSVY